MPPAPRIQFPEGRIPIDLTLISDGEEDELWSVPPSRIAIQNGLMLLRGAAVGPQATRGPGYQTSRKEHTPFDHRVPLSPCSVRLRLGPVAACKPLRQPTPRTLTQKRWKFVTQQSSLYKKLGGFFNRLSQSLLML